jgi:glucuronate isomerase
MYLALTARSKYRSRALCQEMNYPIAATCVNPDRTLEYHKSLNQAPGSDAPGKEGHCEILYLYEFEGE